MAEGVGRHPNPGNAQRLTDQAEVPIEIPDCHRRIVASAEHQTPWAGVLSGIPEDHLSDVGGQWHQPMLSSLSLDLHYKVVEIAVIVLKAQRFTDSESGIQHEQYGCVGSGLIDASGLEFNQSPNVVGGESGQDLRFRFQELHL